MDKKKYEFSVFVKKVVKEQVADPDREISLEDAAEIKNEPRIGESLHVPVRIRNLSKITDNCIKETVRQMDLKNAILRFQKERGLDPDLFKEKICGAIATAARKEFGVKSGVYCEISDDFDIYICQRKTVVAEVEDPDTEMTLEEAIAEKSDAVYGEVIETPMHLDDLGRIAAQSVKHIIRQGVREIENEQVLKNFQSRNNEIVTAKVLSVNAQTGDAAVDISGSEALLPKKDQIPGEELHEGDMIKIYIVDVKESPKGPKVILSRVNVGLVRRLFELEVPEIYDGTVEIRSIAREAGSRTKIAVYAADKNVDPIGACIGPRGERVNRIIEMMGGEKIDIVRYSENPREFISAALAPAEIVSVEIVDEEARSARVTVPENQLSLAIGNKGQNARLAVRLTGWKIDIKPYFGEYKPMIQL
jgi:N utilization substance protein A